MYMYIREETWQLLQERHTMGSVKGMWIIVCVLLISNICSALKQINACEQGHATQGPTTQGKRYAEVAIDGNTDQTLNYASVQASKEVGVTWWSVDLLFRRTILNLTVLFADPGPSFQNHERTIKRRYGYEIYVSNIAVLDGKSGTLCYRDDVSSGHAKPVVSITNCTMPSRYIYIYNTRPLNRTGISASRWPNLEITEVLAFIEQGEAGSCGTGKFGWNCSLSCHCLNSSTCATNGNCQAGCDPHWTGPTCQLQLENVAQGKSASQGPHTKDGKIAEYAVDGVLDQNNNYNHAMDRQENGTTWWQVNLVDIQKIHRIQILFADPDGYERKLRGFSLKISNSSSRDDDNEDLCYQDHSGTDTPYTSITLSDCSSGSYVRLYNSRNYSQNVTTFSKYPHLLITEVEVMAETDCARGSYGHRCEHVCGHCKGGSCNRNDGSCDECVPGWYGNKCDRQCSAQCFTADCEKDNGYCIGKCVAGWYGSKCDQQCSSHCSSEGCVKDSGDCIEDCRIGYYGGQCNETCGYNCEQGCDRNSGRCNNCAIFRYGLFCEHNCSPNCKILNCSGRICGRDTGICFCECKQRYFGALCNKKCPARCIVCQSSTSCTKCERQNWGTRCEKNCAIDCFNQECDRVTGKCHGCSNGKYGDMCSTECPDNCLNNLCYQNGTCQQGCKNSSFYGDQCDKPCIDAISSCKECQEASLMSLECALCSDGKHGKSCELQCPQNCAECRDETICTHCEKGFTGQICDTVCSVQFCLKCGTDGNCIQCEPGKYGKNCEFECPDCETCTLGNNSKSECLTCPKGKYLYTSRNLCIDCEDNCESCISDDKCTSCMAGFYGSRCQTSCPQNCQSCLSSSNCTNCKTGWTGSKCQCNMRNCITDSDQSEWCEADGKCRKGCRRGFFGDQCDTECLGKCESCDQQSGQCKECAAGLYGRTCNHNCSVHCADKDIGGASICDFYDGSCNACDHGWYGPTCNKTCKPNCLTLSGDKGCNQNDGLCQKCTGNKFGPFCELDCPLNCYDRSGSNSCHKDNGTCVSCTDGFYGVYCNESCNSNCKTSCKQLSGDCDECISAFYGRFCEKRCAANCGRGQDSKMIVCNRFSGECLFCEEGYHGETCDLPCSHSCTLGSHKPVCDKADGRCQACMPGYHGHLCEQKCNENCGIAEGETGDTGPCDRNSSLCLHGCTRGWYNWTCLERCNSKCRDETCNIDDGKCTDGCVSGYEGDFCSILAPSGDQPSSAAGIAGAVIGVVLAISILLVVLFFIRKRYFKKSARKGSNTKVHKRAVKNGITSDEIIPLYANVNGANSLPLPARNATKATVEEEVAVDDDESTPLMGTDHKASDYYNLSSQIPVSGFADYVHGRQAANMEWYKDDFAKLPRGLLKNCMVAVSPANRGKCRYKNLYPYDDSRVILEPDGNEKTDFINASYIHGFPQKEAFIAAQGPTEQNVNDFWRMIWQKDCGKIVMLTNLYEDLKIKCIKYWPDEKEQEQYGNLEVESASEEVLSDYTVRHLKVSHKGTREEKDFKHFHFTAWPDRGVPENAGSMLHFRDKVNEANGLPDGPVLVHCSAGIGRTGTFIVIDYLLCQAKAENYVDVFRTVTDMRYQRANFVQTDIQYEFVHKALVEALTTKEMEIPAAEFSRYYWGLLEDRSEYSQQTKLEEQYKTLNEMSVSLDKSNFTSGHLQENIAKNRYPDIVPVDTYRAYLSTPVKGSNEYINAVFLPTCLNKSAFLLTQMPLPHTVTDFWRLVYDQHVTTIVMVNNISDDDDETIGEYWPSEDSTYGPFKIELLSCENHDHYSIMAMKLTYSSSSRQDSMNVRQYRFESWPDGESLPASTKSLVSLTDAVLQSPKTYKDEPVIVHCMNGNDRSGLFCTISAIMAKLQSQQKINIPQTILQLRRRRPQLIPSLEQYDFCHKAISEYLDDSQIYSNVM